MHTMLCDTIRLGFFCFNLNILFIYSKLTISSTFSHVYYHTLVGVLMNLKPRIGSCNGSIEIEQTVWELRVIDDKSKKVLNFDLIDFTTKQIHDG